MLGFLFENECRQELDEGLINRLFIENYISNMEEERKAVFVFIVVIHSNAYRPNRGIVN